MSKPKKLQIVKISDLNSTSKNVILCVSGFLSEESDKVKEWINLTELEKDSEVYALVWASKTGE